jgi:hypothetical protein
MRNWYLIKVIRHSKILGFFILLFIVGQIFFSIKRIHNFPFFIYDMYSRPQAKVENATTLNIYINGKIFDYTQLGEYKEGVLINTIKTYIKAKNSQNILPALAQKVKHINNQTIANYADQYFANDSVAIANFPVWMLHYLEIATKKDINTYQIEESSISYENKWVKDPVAKKIISYATNH